MLGRALQINAADRARRRKPLFPCAGQELLHHRRQLLIRTVVVETEGRRCRQGRAVIKRKVTIYPVRTGKSK